MNCYSRYFSTTDDLRNEKLELKPKFMRSTSLQDGAKSCGAKTTLDFRAPFSFEEVGSFEQLKTNSAKPNKSTKIKCKENKEEKEASERNDCLSSTGIGRKQLGHMDKNSRESEEDTATRGVDVYTTVKPRMKQYCQCFKGNSKTVIQDSENGKDSEKFQNALGHLEKDIPSEIKCAKCHLEIREEWRRRKMVIESWMEFFGSRGTRNSIYTSASSV